MARKQECLLLVVVLVQIKVGEDIIHKPAITDNPFFGGKILMNSSLDDVC